jgi:hypothetical protein
MPRPVHAWHFLPNPGRLKFSLPDGRKPWVLAGSVLHVPGPLRLCSHGLHGSRLLVDAWGYGYGWCLCRTLHWGEVVEESDKLCSAYRRVVWRLPASATFPAWRAAACAVVRRILDEVARRSRLELPALRRYVSAARPRPVDLRDAEDAAVSPQSVERLSARACRLFAEYPDTSYLPGSDLVDLAEALVAFRSPGSAPRTAQAECRLVLAKEFEPVFRRHVMKVARLHARRPRKPSKV